MTVTRRPHVQAALQTLRTAADRVRGWPDTTWIRVAGPAPESVRMQDGGFDADVLRGGETTVLSWRAVVPHEIDDVAVAGDALEATVASLHPLEIHHDDVRVLDARRVAPGPALVTVVPSLCDGDNGEVRLTLHTPAHELGWQWLRVHLTTPSRRARFELIDTAWARIALAEQVARTDAARRCVDDAVEAVADGGEDWDRVAARVAAALAPLADEVAALTVHLIGHSHIDMNWQWTWSDTTEVILRDLASAISILDDHPEVTFTHSQPATYEVVRSHDPALFERIREHVQSGRWEPATMQWVEGDTNMASGEATVRQLREAVHWTRDMLGVTPSVHLAPDTFGHAGNLPQLTRGAGASIYYHHRCNPGGVDPWPAYWWEGDDGSRVLACSTPSYNGDISPSAVAVAAITAYAHGLRHALHFHGVGNHGGGPARHDIAMARRLQEQPGMPQLRFSTLGEYRDSLLADSVELPVHRGESATIFEGCYSTHADIKTLNRRCENALLSAEALHVLAGGDPVAETDDAWRRLMFHQFHDILPGSAIHASYEQTAEDADVVELAATRITERALTVLAAGVDSDDIVVVNPTADDRTDVVTASSTAATWAVGCDGSRTPVQRVDGGVCFVARVPGFGRAVYRLSDEEAAPPMTVDATVSPVELAALELAARPLPPEAERRYIRVRTGVFDVHVRRDAGVITSLIERRTGVELVANAMRRGADYIDDARTDLAVNVLQLVDEHPHAMSAWHLDEVWRETSLLRGASTTAVEAGPVRAVLETVHRVRASTITQRMTLYAELPRVDIELDIDWREPGNAEAGVPSLKVAVTAADAGDAWFETPYAAVRRPANGQEVPALRWAAVCSPAGGIALLNDSRYGHDALGSRLRMTLVRSAYDPDPVSDEVRHRVRYAIVPFAGDPFDAGIPALAAAFNQPLVAVTGTAGEAGAGLGWRPHVDATTARIGALTTARDGSGDIILRVADVAGRAATAVLDGLPPRADVREVSVVEDDLGPLHVTGGRLALELAPWQVRTLRVRCSPQ